MGLPPLFGDAMTKAKEIIDRVVTVLQDPEFVRWDKPQLLDWISEAQIAIARTPGAHSRIVAMRLKTGTMQDLPQDAWGLISITRNVDEDGAPLTPVRLVTRALLDVYFPYWHMITPRPLVENYTYDDRFPKQFSVFPPNDGSGSVEVIYSAIPAEITDEDDEIALDDTFIPAIVSYALYRATAVESDYAPGVQNAASWYQSYTAELAQAMQIRGQITPNAALMPDQPVNANGGTE